MPRTGYSADLEQIKMLDVRNARAVVARHARKVNVVHHCVDCAYLTYAALEGSAILTAIVSGLLVLTLLQLLATGGAE